MCSTFAQCDSIGLEVVGMTMTNSSSYPKLTIKEGAEMPVVGVKGKLYKYFETELLGGVMTGWLGVGEVKVIKVNGAIVHFKMEEETSVMTINGKKASHFNSGKKMRFEWLQPPTKKLKEARWSNGNLKYSGFQFCGKKVDTWKHYYSNGQIKSRVYHSTSAEPIPDSTWYENGQLK